MRRNAPYLRHCSFFLGIFWPSLFADCTLGCLYFSVISPFEKVFLLFSWFFYKNVDLLLTPWTIWLYKTFYYFFVKFCCEQLIFKKWFIINWYFILTILVTFPIRLPNRLCLRISLDSGSILECQLYLAIFCMISFEWTAEVEYKKMADNSNNQLMFCYFAIFLWFYI